ncbi:shikimate dehydrogenase [Bacillus atrophaeus]|uniref:shikimate dehydrogenase n=1 Tax=Bacillus atrophaeus TaxID=1452 RepID=UPI00077A3DD3|nr:shikimate dehydrogenase [Bacillus atrophaeus]ARW05859.1 Shikimate dehydrogenase [Bacillus atrophaeus]ATO29914.1 shikimate dehydrogenase [Bacillus atrophaeus]KXZ16423.1 quinate/shikimate dehydrogenase [Bacillus atrophaeus]MBU5262399.1 shikimate dehydrogenase [Bacillus atrophaeus]MCY7947382.1 shikimate dehydrogenase [Bacillus atrophaeus]
MTKELGRINGKTQLIGLLATPIGHSLSPTMHNLAFKKLGLNYAYLAFEVGNEQLEDVVTGMRALGVRGFNVSMPNKMKIIPYLDQLADSAKFSGAVNTVVNDNGTLTGHSTDGMGYVRNLKEHGVDIAGKKMTLIGSGGAATPIAIQSALEGLAEISIFARNDAFFEKAVENVRIINEDMKDSNCKANVYPLEDQETLRAEIASSDILANGTGVGMKPLEGLSVIEDVSMLRPDLIVSDVVYNPVKSKLLEQAEEAGCKTINGLGMMVWQGAMAFELWTGKEMPVAYINEQMFE